MEKNIVFTDFDGTLTYKDSFLEFLKFYVGMSKLFFGLLANAPHILAYKLKIISNERAKEKLFSYFFAGKDITEFQLKCDQFSVNIIPKILREKAKTKITEHQTNKHQIVVVSASIENYLQEWCKNNQFDCIATQIEIKNQKITGKFLSKNCYGQEKVTRIQEKYSLQDYAVIYAYGDTEGDKPMLNIANQPQYKPFHHNL